MPPGIDFDLGEVLARHELAEKLTSLGLFAVYCKDAVNPARPEEERKKSLLLANAHLDAAAVKKAFGELQFDTFLTALRSSQTQKARKEILDEYRVDERDPDLGKAINVLYPLPKPKRQA